MHGHVHAFVRKVSNIERYWNKKGNFLGSVQLLSPVSTVSPFICHEVMGLDAMIFVF